MSWEICENKQPCPCGRSTITSKWKEGDWPSQYVDLGEVIDCEICNKEWEFKVVSYRSDDRSPRISLVRKDEMK